MYLDDTLVKCKVYPEDGSIITLYVLLAFQLFQTSKLENRLTGKIESIVFCSVLLL